MSKQDQTLSFTRRAMMLLSMQGVLTLGLVGRLYYLQIAQGKNFKILSDKNRIQTIYTPPRRGFIYDRSGIILANNRITYRSVLDPDEKENSREILEKLRGILQYDDATIAALWEQIKKSKRRLPISLKDNLSWDELAQLELHAPDLLGVTVEKDQSRFYPYPLETCHVIGYVAAASEREVDTDPTIGITGNRIGKNGLEKTYDTHLRGKHGLKQVEVNATRRVVRDISSIPSISGDDITLTIDFPLQQAVHDILQREISGTGIVLDVHTGAVLAAVSHPGFDCNLMTTQISKGDWQKIVQQQGKPLNNKIISGQYSPGSTFKMMVALAGLTAGVIDEDTQFFCPGHYDAHGHRFHCWNWKQGGHGTMDLQHALAASCDVYFYSLASLLGVDKIAAVAQAFGFGDCTGIELNGEKKGLVPTKNWKRIVKQQAWSPGETINVSIGQGYVLSTPLQLVKMMAQLVNGLHPVTPHLLKDRKNPILPRLPYDPEHIKIILDGMEQTVNSPWGTAYASRIATPGQEMGGKTGSTQVSRISQQQRQAGTVNDRPYHLKEHSLFVGYAPIQLPRFAVSVLVEHGGGGAKVAAPLAKEIMIAAQRLVPVGV
ncbi:MAG: penicillin-binding protein 2 [Alphaproteobacteria bacterium]|nr:penicillin-binding protein 2 [Alphaproteobacteria bacterium]